MVHVLRKVPFKGYRHPQYFPTAHKVARKITGKSMVKAVEREIKKTEEMLEKQNVESSPVRYYLNNFFLRLSGFKGSYRRHKLHFLKKYWDTPHKGILIDLGKGPVRVYEEKSHSAVFLRQIPREFYQTFDRALKETGVDITKVKKLLFSDSFSDFDEAAHLLLPAFIRLREWGYKKGELTS